jgi:hypothetical protein
MTPYLEQYARTTDDVGSIRSAFLIEKSEVFLPSTYHLPTSNLEQRRLTFKIFLNPTTI